MLLHCYNALLRYFLQPLPKLLLPCCLLLLHLQQLLAQRLVLCQ
jgi:hypothetical protein